MAVVRTVLPRKGIIQPQDGTAWSTDGDANWKKLDDNVAFMSDLSQQQLGSNGLISGFALSTSSSLTPGITAGALMAQGVVYAPSAAPVISAAPASATSYLFYNSTDGFYWQASAVGATAGDALIGSVTTDASAVTAVQQATAINGWITVTAAEAGNFSVPHLLGRVPVGVNLQMTSATLIWWQDPMFDGTDLYLVASVAGAVAKVQIW